MYGCLAGIGIAQLYVDREVEVKVQRELLAMTRRAVCTLESVQLNLSACIAKFRQKRRRTSTARRLPRTSDQKT